MGTSLPSKACTECGTAFSPGSNRAKRCSECRPKVRAKREAERRKRLRGGLPPMGPDEKRIDAEARAVERLVAAMRLRSFGTEQDLLTEIFAGEGYTVVIIASSKSKGDLDRLGRHDAASREYGTEKKIP